jgi:Coenzyme PQQ synthesis protein D (PqqD)
MSTDTQVLERTKDIVSRRIAGELFLVPVAGDLANMQRMFALTSVAEFIWERLDGRRSVGFIIEEVASRFDVERERAESDMREFVDELAAAGLVRETGSPR